MWWLLLVPLGLVAVYFLMSATIGVTAKPEATGFHFLKQAFKTNGVPHHLYGDECLKGLVDSAVRVGKMRSTLESTTAFNVAFVSQLNAIALIAAQHYNGQLTKFDMDSSIVKSLQQSHPVKQSFEG